MNRLLVDETAMVSVTVTVPGGDPAAQVAPGTVVQVVKSLLA